LDKTLVSNLKVNNVEFLDNKSNVVVGVIITRAAKSAAGAAAMEDDDEEEVVEGEADSEEPASEE